MKKFLFVAIALMISGIQVFPNNIMIENVVLTDQNPVEHFCSVQFDLHWENSWRNDITVPFNWDAAWVFIKFRVAGSGPWKHGTLHPTGFLAPDGGIIRVSPDSVGAFIYRMVQGSGDNHWFNVRIRWDYGADGVEDDDPVEVKVFGIEMVYIPQGPFRAGDGDGTTESAYAFHHDTSNLPLEITASLSDTLRVDDGCLGESGAIVSPGIRIDGDGGIDSNLDGVIENPDYPTGFRGFYIMKYEISQEQYKDFLNCLSRHQQTVRSTVDEYGTMTIYPYVMTKTMSPTLRQGIATGSSFPNFPASITMYCDLNPSNGGDSPDDGQNIACNYMSYMDVAAYSDWAGLRPMTELEFEKACRGPNNPKTGEYGWGTTNVHEALLTLQNAGTTNETVLNPPVNTGLASFSTTTFNAGPFRCGIFAHSSVNKTREEAGATHYGVMEMSGNIRESCVNLGTVAGRSFTGKHGNGVLNTEGDADVDFWPGINGNSDATVPNTPYGGTVGVSQAAGQGNRGGGFYYQGTTYLRISDRDHTGTKTPFRSQSFGGRGVRTAPEP